MPTYEYECPKCGNVFDEFQSISAPPVANCPAEGCGEAAKRRFSPGAGFIFKGSGFYSTDYRSDSYRKGAKADSSAPGAPSGGGTSGANAGASPSSSTPSSTSASTQAS